MFRDIGLQPKIRLVFKEETRVEGCILCGLLLGEGWSDCVCQRLYVIITQFNKSSVFCSEYSLFVVGIHAQAANLQSSSLNYYATARPT
jgi:hypothetical protein